MRWFIRDQIMSLTVQPVPETHPCELRWYWARAEELETDLSHSSGKAPEFSHEVVAVTHIIDWHPLETGMTSTNAPLVSLELAFARCCQWSKHSFGYLASMWSNKQTGRCPRSSSTSARSVLQRPDGFIQLFTESVMVYRMTWMSNLGSPRTHPKDAIFFFYDKFELEYKNTSPNTFTRRRCEINENGQQKLTEQNGESSAPCLQINHWARPFLLWQDRMLRHDAKGLV